MYLAHTFFPVMTVTHDAAIPGSLTMLILIQSKKKSTIKVVEYILMDIICPWFEYFLVQAGILAFFNILRT